jgi:glycosyltransferase involved in cell wall biosynthesis
MSGQKVFDIDHSWIGGTELMALNMEKYILPIAPQLAEWNWIIAPGKINLREDGKNIAWVHLGDFEGDLSWLQDQRVAHIIFVSYYQYQRFMERYPNIDNSKCHVIRNAIDPIPVSEYTLGSKIKLVFHCEPYRGLEILIDALSLIKDPDIELHVIGDLDTKTIDWKIDIQNKIKESILLDDRIIYHGRLSNDNVRKQLQNCHIFAYPSTWRETSCISLIEAMSAGLYCITNSFTVLPETGIGLTKIYPFDNDLKNQALTLSKKILEAVDSIKKKRFDPINQAVKTNDYYSWKSVSKEWLDFSNKI